MLALFKKRKRQPALGFCKTPAEVMCEGIMTTDTR